MASSRPHTAPCILLVYLAQQTPLNTQHKWWGQESSGTCVAARVSAARRARQKRAHGVPQNRLNNFLTEHDTAGLKVALGRYLSAAQDRMLRPRSGTGHGKNTGGSAPPPSKKGPARTIFHGTEPRFRNSASHCAVFGSLHSSYTPLSLV